ncbi:MAG TPA: ABC transporter permease [Acidimicrobiia bacterium]|nr:ABC transporter permease [Acidimicrobiia bacterium]
MIRRRAAAIGVPRLLLIALGVVLLAFILLNAEYRHNFLTGGGVAEGALIAAIALGVVLTYRGSGVVNFANGAIAMYVAYVYTILRRSGKLFLPPIPNPLKAIEGLVHASGGSKSFTMPNIPVAISFGTTMGFWPALALSLAFCVLLGLGLHFLVFRPLRNAPPLAKVVASVGVLVFLQAIIILRYNTTVQTVRPLPIVHKTQVRLPFIKLAQDQLFVAILVIVFTVLLSMLFRYTRFGLATRAAAENEKGAVVLGFSPDFLAGTNWVLSTVITGLLGILVASVNTTMDPVSLAALIVPALTAALVGSFSSFWRTTLAAFVLGMQVPLVQYISANKSWFPSSNGVFWPGFEYLLPVVVIVLVLFLIGSTLPTRGAISSGRLPFAPSPPAWTIRYGGPALAVFAAICGLFLFSPVYRGALANTLIGIIICLSIVVVTGFVGQISLAQMSFAGISAFVVSKLSFEHGWPFPWPILFGALVALVVGLLVAIPALRVRGVNLAIITFAFAVAIDYVVFGNNSVTGGYNGAPVHVPSWINPNNPGKYHFLGLTAGDGLQPNPMTAIFCLVAVVVLCYLVANLRRSTTGRQMLAMRSNERAAAAAGVNVAGTKLLAFAVSAFVAGIGGGVLAYQAGAVTADPFSYRESLVFFAFAYLGGISTVSGAVVGGFLVEGGLLFTLLEDKFGMSPGMVLVIGGLGLIVAAIQNPEGIAGNIALGGKRLRAWLRGRSTGATDAQPAVAASGPGAA